MARSQNKNGGQDASGDVDRYRQAAEDTLRRGLSRTQCSPISAGCARSSCHRSHSSWRGAWTSSREV